MRVTRARSLGNGTLRFARHTNAAVELKFINRGGDETGSRMAQLTEYVAGVTAEQIARRIMEMVRAAAQRGHEGLYLDCGMAPSGGFWRYQIGVIRGLWPGYDNDIVYGSIGGGFNQVSRGARRPMTSMRSSRSFKSRYGAQLERAKVGNAAYADWYTRMLRDTGPDGVLIFYADYRPRRFLRRHLGTARRLPNAAASGLSPLTYSN